MKVYLVFLETAYDGIYESTIRLFKSPSNANDYAKLVETENNTDGRDEWVEIKELELE